MNVVFCTCNASSYLFSLIYSLTGKMREIKNSTTKGGNYYQSLLLGHSNFQKQIRLDLYRTIPSNKHFKMEGKGVSWFYNISWLLICDPSIRQRSYNVSWLLIVTTMLMLDIARYFYIYMYVLYSLYKYIIIYIIIYVA